MVGSVGPFVTLLSGNLTRILTLFYLICYNGRWNEIKYWLNEIHPFIHSLVNHKNELQAAVIHSSIMAFWKFVEGFKKEASKFRNKKLSNYNPLIVCLDNSGPFFSGAGLEENSNNPLFSHLHSWVIVPSLAMPGISKPGHYPPHNTIKSLIIICS